MTAQLLTFETTSEYNEPVQVSLFYDKYMLFCVAVTLGDPEKRYPSYITKHNPDLLPALRSYKRQVKKYTVMGVKRTETISSLFDECYKSANNKP